MEKYQLVIGPKQKSTFKELKKQLTFDSLLVYYDPDVKLILSCDASAYGVGAVLLHLFNDGIEKLITFASQHQHLQKAAMPI